MSFSGCSPSGENGTAEKETGRSSEKIALLSGAGNEIRTRDFNLGKVALYH